ncbi:peptide chain release factor N(5)-glutamine methyltransferase [Thiomicrorhabdus sediminis]|uniref:Release factor glutamine methyltransferase n=1 Tax=Thiomicrorhabdus sediminis TaxID=2580412 RepID=A0A4P9K4Z7_9GAMM|nr:peptide chain release factor N(5)-glutamine methyltransferase [Thiomicrorhabdus sediminis]QCU89500.1 peptide chain release factor N(5)-glutamine methyltransferase [Thiomicrorhabdus sediminis]
MSESNITIAELLHSASQRLSQAGVDDSPKLDAELLLCHILDKPRSFIFTWPEKLIEADQLKQFEALLQQRMQHQPIAYLLGYKEFWGLPLKVSPSTLIPRADTEILVETALSLLPTPSAESIKLLDMGTGTGAIALAIKMERPDIQVSALDFQAEAVQLAMTNAKQLDLPIEVLQSDWFSALRAQRFDMIVSNPPYIEDNDQHLKQGDVQFEPLSALTSGQSGLEDIAWIINQSRDYLKSGAWLLLEHGYNQAESVAQLFSQYGFKNYRLIKDLADNPRISLAQYGQ